uniref:Coat protein n=1 Tax=Erysiphales associated totivirus 18 TaxID=2719847 RepID=A0A6G9EN88_9VIRU|nr:coat protein [Erysiphales associated totivirus 18]
MDKVIKQVFKSEGVAGMAIKHDNGNYNTLLRGNLAVEVAGVNGVRKMVMAQSMTYLGRSTAIMGSGSSDLEGVNKFCLTPEGNLNMTNILATVSKEAGLQPADQTLQLEQIKFWTWADNHVALLVNLLRFALLREMAENSGGVGLAGHLPKYNDGHVTVDRTKLLPAEYPVGGDMKWFTDFDSDYMPETRHTSKYLGHKCDVSLDLRGLTEQEATIVLLCCGRWSRQSRYLLDFDTPKLTDALVYRSHKTKVEISAYDAELEEHLEHPALPDAKTIWRALHRYVCVNRLYSQYSTALALIAQITCQFLPATAEANVWLTYPRVIHLPMLKSMRGSLPFINADEPALVSQRALNEWAVFGVEAQRYNLLANILSQAVQTGVAVRALRFRNEDNPDDLYRTYDAVNNPPIMYGALCSEALRCPVPLAGMMNVFVELELPDERSSVDMNIPVTMATPRETGYDIRTQGSESKLHVSSLPMAGVPTLLLPLNPLGHVTPFNLRGSFDTSTMRRTKMGWETSLYEAWNWAWVSRLCGYDLQMMHQYGASFGSRAYAPNESSWTWPLLGSVSHNGTVCINKMSERADSWIDLPALHSRMFNGVINYRFVINSHCVSLPNRQEPEVIGDMFSAAPVLSLTHVALTSMAEVIKLKGFIDRSESDFRFVDDVQAGQIPPVQIPNVASDVIE